MQKNKVMIKVLKNNATMCPNCKKFLEFEVEDIKTGEEEYLVYGCEKRFDEYCYIICPCCKHEIILK